MALSIKSLGRGQVPTTQGDICGPVATAKAYVVRNMRFVNTGAASATLNVFFKRGSSTYRVMQKDISIAAGALVVDRDEIALEANDSIQAVVASGNTVDYVISGIERDA